MYAAALFHCQQALSKALKGFLTYHQVPSKKTHDLYEIGALCLAIDGSLSPMLASAQGLSKYAWLFRYPGAPCEPDAAEATQWLETATVAPHDIERRLPV